MSVASEITRIQNAKASLKSSINAKTDSEHQITTETIDDYSDFVDSISGGVDINDYYTTSNKTNGYNAMALIKKFPYAIDFDHATDGTNKFSGFRNLQEVSIKNCEKMNSLSYLFGNCVSLQFIDIRDMVLSVNHNGYTTMFGNTSSNRVPYSCLIIVKDNTEKQWMNSNLPNYTNVKTVEEYEGQ